MIKLIVNPRTKPTTYTFDKTTVIIGAPKHPDVDLSLAQEQLQPIHIKIMEQGNRFIAINQANDPFVTINGIPFGKKVIHPSDIIEVGATQIAFDGAPTASNKEKDRGIADTAVALPSLLDKVIAQKEKEAAHGPANVMHQPSFEAQSKGILSDEEAFDLEEEMRELDAWLQETSHLSPDAALEEAPNTESQIVDLFEEEEELFSSQAAAQAELPPAPKAAAPLAAASKPVHKQTIKDLYFKDHEDEGHRKGTKMPGGAGSQAAAPRMDWHTLWIIVVGVLSTIIIIALLLYANASGKSEDDELKAAESVADVAMALAYAQLNNIVPQNQNWSDPQFLKNNLTAVLSAEFPQLVQLDSHGQFTNSPYLLRIYTSSDLSNFLVMAQPAPSLLHWLIPKSTIVVYSKEMELRKTGDLKSLNRLLVNPSLDGTVADEVAAIVKKAELITLTSISKRQHRLGFSPPKALALFRPGAENKIYNAPRYYNLGEPIIRDAMALADDQENSHEVVLLQQQIEALRRYPNLVLYSSQGLQAAIDAQKALALFEPEASFLIAYLQYNSHGTVHSSHLLMDDPNSELAMKDSPPALTDRRPAAPPSVVQQHGSQDRIHVSHSDIAHPLFFQLSALSASRQQLLKPISGEISALLNAENEAPHPGFRDAFLALADKYIAAVDEQQKRIVKGISKLYQEHPTMPLSEFMHYVQAAGAEGLAREALKEELERGRFREVGDEEVAAQLQKIDESGDWVQLEAAVLDADKMFTLENVPDPEKVIRLQNNVKAKALERVNAFILSANQTLPSGSFNEENRSRLQRILKAAWVRDQEEVDYYINEYNELADREPIEPPAQPQQPQQPSPTASIREHNRFWQQGRVWKKQP